MMEKTKSCVIGAGHGGMAMAGHLGVMGFEVNLFNRSPERIGAVQWRRGIDLDGEVEGFGSVKLATTDIKAAITGVKIIMVVVPANAHRVIAEIVALSYRLSAGGAEKIFMALKETIRGARMIAKAGVLDILKKGGGK